VIPAYQASYLWGVLSVMDEETRGITPESWLVSAGRTVEPGAPLNVPLIPASDFIFSWVG